VSSVFEIDWEISVVRVIDTTTGKPSSVFTFNFLDNIEDYCPDYETVPVVYNAWQWYLNQERIE